MASASSHSQVAPDDSSAPSTNAHGHFEPLRATLEQHATELSQVQSSIEQPVDPVFLANPDMVYRFLRGWHFDVPSTVERINKAQQYRHEHGLNAIREKAVRLSQQQFPHAERVLKYWPHVILHGEDKHGQPLSIERLGHSDPSALCKVVTLEQLMEYHHYHMENKGALFSQLSTQKDTVIRACKIMDLQGLGKQHLTTTGYRYFKAVISASQDNYPETMGSLFVINAPWIFPVAWRTVSPLLHSAVREKIHILGSNYQAVLQQHIPKHHIPREFGGDCTCDGKGCVPLYNPEDDMTKLHVKAGAKADHSVPLPKAAQSHHHLVSYEFRMHSHDIAFSMAVVREGGKREVLVGSARVGSEGEVRDAVTVEGEGEVRVTFDNSYSRFTGKTLWFRVDVQELGEQELQASKEIAQEEEKRSPRTQQQQQQQQTQTAAEAADAHH